MRVLILCVLCLVSIKVESSDSSVRDMLKNHAPWVQDCQDNRVYLKKDCLELTDNGILIHDESNRNIFSVTEIFCDSQGIYTKIESLGTDIATVYPIVWCRTCEGWRVVNIKGRCGVCGNIP